MAQKTKKNRRKGDRSSAGSGASPGATRDGRPKREDQSLIWGIHPALEALSNPDRTIVEVFLSKEQAARFGPDIDQRLRSRKLDVPIYIAQREDFADLCGPQAVHQGLVVRAHPLTDLALDDLVNVADATAPCRLMVLDQVSDPHNVGAILRSAAVFGADAVIVQDRNSPELTPTLLKSASGAGEHVPLIRVTNIARTCDQLVEAGFAVIGLAAEGTDALANMPRNERTALVMGAEGSGIRRLVRERCSALAYLPNVGAITHLNVSNAAAVALYELIRA